MKKAIILTEEEYNDIVAKMNRYHNTIYALEQANNTLEEKAKRLWNEANMPAIEELQKQHDEEYLAWCEEISAKYEEADYIAWCEETAKKYDDMYWANKYNCNPEDLKWISWVKKYAQNALEQEEEIYYDWRLVCKCISHIHDEENGAYRCLYHSYYFYNTPDDSAEWWFNMYKSCMELKLK